MSQIIAVISGKGGTGKTTFTSSVGIALADMGHHTLVLDCDITLKNLDLALGLSDRALMDFSDVLSGRCSLKEAAVSHGDYPNLDFITAPSFGSNDTIPIPDITRLRWEICEKYEYCLVDAPAGMGAGFQMALQLADRIVVVANAETTSLRDAQRTVMELKNFKDGSVHLAMNRVDKKSIKKILQTIDDAMDFIGIPLLGIIPEDKNVPIIMNRGLPLKKYDYPAAHAFDNIAKRITGMNVPLEEK